MARIASSLAVLRTQVDRAYPYRHKDDDGWIASAQHHLQNPNSDHEPNAAGVVTALDLTHDPAHGFDSYAFADMLKANGDDRIKYLISNRRISNPSIENWGGVIMGMVIHIPGISTFQYLPSRHFMTIQDLRSYQR